MLDSEFEKRLDNIRENDHFPKLQNAHFSNKRNKHANYGSWEKAGTKKNRCDKNMAVLDKGFTGN
jgi:hypothetical protein